MSTYKYLSVNNQTPTLVDEAVYGDVRFDASDALPDYVGMHLTNGAATTNSEWKIYKFTYSGSDATRIQLAYGAWDSRTGLF